LIRAFGRIGTAYQKQGDLANAVEYYQRSLTEHRTPDILTKLRAAEKAKIEAEKQAYIDPAKAEEAREQGNQYFKDANWVEAVKSYTEMIKRNPEDPRGYSNLAAALTKLGSLPEAIKNCDEAIKRDPHFLRAHIRKAQAFILMKEFNKALDALTEASTQDKDGKGANEIEKLTREVLEKQYAAREGETEEETMARVQRDPEVSSLAPIVRRALLTYQLDCFHHPRPSHAEHPSTGQSQPTGPQ
jgi:stress-induced-phosphoprotein 1